MSQDDQTAIVHSTSTKEAALRYAQENALPINATIEVRDMNDRPHTYRVERSFRSQGMLDGGGVVTWQLLYMAATIYGSYYIRRWRCYVADHSEG